MATKALVALVLLLNHCWSFILPHIHSRFLTKAWASLTPIRPAELRNKNRLIDTTPRLYCNVELNVAYIEAIGFDMDFTLAQYNAEHDKLLFDSVKIKMHKDMQYPDSVLNFEFRAGAMCRGLVVDKQRGYVLKIDRNKYVRKAMHGFEALGAESRKTTYNKEVVSFSEDNFVNIDSTSLLVEALLFTHLVDLRKRCDFLQLKSCEDLYRDVREAMTSCMESPQIRHAVMAHPERYIKRDPELVQTVQQLRRAGKKIFLLTNSLWEYTNSVMSFLFQSDRDCVADWTDLFDLVIVGANKPAFLTNDALNLFRVDRASGKLLNIEDKDGIYSQTRVRGENSGTNIFQGGCWQDLHHLLGVSYGDKILYVADQMFSDILRSKRSLGWRTCLVVPELEHEVQVATREKDLREKIWKLKQEQLTVDECIDGMCGASGLQEELEKALQHSDEIKSELSRLNVEYDDKFGEPWGQLFKAGIHDSRFGKQVQNYACLYTSRVSNLLQASPTRTFRPVQDFMLHDQVVLY